MRLGARFEHTEPKEGARYFNLTIQNKSISPCTITWNYKHTNKVYWKGRELEKSDLYWFSLGDELIKIGDRFEVVTTHLRTGEIMRVVTLEVIDIKDQYRGLRAIEIARWDAREEQGPRLETKCEVCPTCKRPM